jgi:hypothetical protein
MKMKMPEPWRPSGPWRLNLLPERLKNVVLWHCFAVPWRKDSANL